MKCIVTRDHQLPILETEENFRTRVNTTVADANGPLPQGSLSLEVTVPFVSSENQMTATVRQRVREELARVAPPVVITDQDIHLFGICIR